MALAAYQNHTGEPLPATDRLQTEFVSVVSHELRTPVSAIQGYTDLLLEGAYGELAAEQREIIAYMKESAGTLRGMIDNLLNLSLMNRGQTDLVLRTFPVEEVAREVLMTCRAESERKQLPVTHCVEPADLSIRSDKIKLQQILTNLVVNAIRYTDKGFIHVHARGPAGADGMFELAVSDSGTGISVAEQQKIFRRFYRVEHAAERDSQGMGLGLFIVHSLVEMLGGTIAVESEPGRGSTFTIRLPVLIEDTTALQNLVHFNQQASAQHGGPKNPAGERIVLFLGSDAEKSRTLGRTLNQDGIRVISVEGMGQVIHKVNLHRPQAIVLDPDFAEHTAGDAFQELKQHPLMKAIPVLFFMESVASPTRGHDLAATAANDRSRPYRVLVTDDDPGMREALQIALECEGYDVLLAADGAEALKLLAEQHPDVMLLDLMMPGLNGWQVIDILAQKPELRDTKVLMLTGAALSAEETQKLNASTGGLLRKDEFKLNNILAGITRAIGRQ